LIFGGVDLLLFTILLSTIMHQFSKIVLKLILNMNFFFVNLNLIGWNLSK